MFTSPDYLDLLNLSTVFDVCDVGRGNLAISKLLAKKKCTFFAIYILQDASITYFGGVNMGISFNIKCQSSSCVLLCKYLILSIHQ